MQTKNPRTTLFATLALFTVLNLLGCASPQAADSVTQSSSKPRESAPDVHDDSVSALAKGNSAFAFDLYQQIRGGSENIFYSPYSISAALAMTYAGARGETGQQMARTLHYTLPQDELHPAFNWLDQTLAGRGESAQGQDDGGFRLRVVNTIWGQKDYAFLMEYLDTLARNYGAGLRILDFAADAEAARQAINDWVSEQTEERITDLIPEGVLDPTTRLVLTNAIYFNAAWMYPFPEHQTAEAPFHLLDGGDVEGPMMHISESFLYAEDEDYQALSLPYDGGELEMVVVLPQESRFEQLEARLDEQFVEGMLRGMTLQQVNLGMPRFEFDADLRLTDTLAEMGMPDAFSGNADFSGMTGDRALSISDVLHKAFVLVDESGTEAAAATAVVMKELEIAPGEPVEMTLDRPFVFFIRDIETGSILFLGRVVDPS
ncbi:MAG: serpin family protein [Anaerolineae bacterium]|nr:serpin family protein [Anaerolineae bacterium]